MFEDKVSHKCKAENQREGGFREERPAGPVLYCQRLDSHHPYNKLPHPDTQTVRGPFPGRVDFFLMATRTLRPVRFRSLHAQQILRHVVPQLPTVPDWPEHPALDSTITTARAIRPAEATRELPAILDSFTKGCVLTPPKVALIGESCFKASIC